MNDFIKKTMTAVIVGDEENEKFDGRIKVGRTEDGFTYHRDSIKNIVYQLDLEGYSVGNVDFSNANEAGFDLVNKGHIMFLNCTTQNYVFGYVFLPNTITKKQIESLKVFEPALQQFPHLYIMKVNELDRETFNTDSNVYDFNVDSILEKYYTVPKVKTKTK